MKKCSCGEYSDIELIRKAINERIKKSKDLKKQLKLVSKSDTENILFVCEICNQFWQSSRAWNWGNDEYLFKVPIIELQDWIQNQFMAPDEMLIYSAGMSVYMESNINSFVDGNEKCIKDDCIEKSLKGGKLCKNHFIENLGVVGLIPKRPKGRLFKPYQD